MFFSMASSGDDVTRGMSFLFSRNRLNVAVSRAQASPSSSARRRLMTSTAAPSSTWKLANALCRFDATDRRWSGPMR